MGLSLRRILIPKSLTLIFLGGFLYFGVWLNLLILNVVNFPLEWHLYIIMGIFILLILQAALNYIRFSNYKYVFFRDRLIFYGKKELIIPYSQIQDINYKREPWDFIFNTGNIILTPVHTIKYIYNTNQLYFYIQKLVDMDKSSPHYNQAQAYPQQQYYPQAQANQYVQQRNQAQYAQQNQYAPQQNSNTYYQQQVR